MKIGIVGEPERASAWEQHMRSIQGIKEVIISREIDGLGEVDAVVMLVSPDESPQPLIQAIRRNWHVFLISKPPTDLEWVESLYYQAEEANVILQFSHWPTLSPASQQMFKTVPAPRTIQIYRELQPSRFRELDLNFDDLWIDELGFCCKWMNSNVKQVDAQWSVLTPISEKSDVAPLAIQIALRFDNGGFAGIQINAASRHNLFKRYGSDRRYFVESNVLSNELRIGQLNSQNRVFFERQEFDPSDTAPLALHHFIKSIKMKKHSLFNGFDLLQLNRALQMVRTRLDY